MGVRFVADVWAGNKFLNAREVSHESHDRRIRKIVSLSPFLRCSVPRTWNPLW